MPVKGKPLGRTTYKDISKVYLKDGRTVNAIYAPMNGHYELVYDTSNTSTIKGTLPLTFTDDPTNNGANTFDVGTTNKPTKASVSW